MPIISNKIIDQYLELKLKQVNENTETKKVIEELCEKYPDRSTWIKLTDLGEFVGFGLDTANKKLTTISKLTTKPTLIISCTTTVFTTFIAGKVSIDRLFWSDDAEVVGDDILRDKVILEGYQHIFKTVGFMEDGV